MTRYTELRHAGYFQPDLTDKQRQAIEDQVDGTTRTETPKQSTVSHSVSTTPKAAKGKRSGK